MIRSCWFALAATASYLASGQTQMELVGKPVTEPPYHLVVQAFHVGDPIHVALSESWASPGSSITVYVTEHQTWDAWQLNPTLVDVRDSGPQTLIAGAGGLASNSHPLSGTEALLSTTGERPGRSYDVVIDLDGDGSLSEGDRVDGGSRPGMTMLGNLNQPGNHEVATVEHAPSFWHTQRIFYPTDVASMPPQPLVVISHGWTHEYTYYDHLGAHLASYGYVVMTHRNDVGNGGAGATETASQTALENIHTFLDELGTIAGGILEGHVDNHRIVHMGHSTGGECVVRAYKRLVEGSFVSPHFAASDVVLLTSLAPVSFLPAEDVSPMGVPFHQFFCGADTDVSGDAWDGYVQGLALFERAEGPRMLTYIHGAGHEDLHANDGPSWANGPDLIGREATHSVLLPMALAGCEWHARGNDAVSAYFTRNRMEFSPLDVAPEVTVTGEYRPSWNTLSDDVTVLDDYQTAESLETSTCGGSVTATNAEIHEVWMNDVDESFDWLGDNWANGMTRSRFDDQPRCLTLAWEGDASYCQTLPSSLQDWTNQSHLAFRLAQLTRHPLNADSAGLALAVQLNDGLGNTWTTPLAPWGRVRPPYPRNRGGHYTACLVNGTYTLTLGGSTWPEEQFITVPGYLDYVGMGTYTFVVDSENPCEDLSFLCYDTWGDGWDSGTFEVLDEDGALLLEGTLSGGSTPDLGFGWQNEFHSYHLPLAQIAVEGSNLDLGQVTEVCLVFGTGNDSPSGAVAMDDLALLGTHETASTFSEPSARGATRLRASPTPCSESCQLSPPQNRQPWTGEVVNLHGMRVVEWHNEVGTQIVDVRGWPSGVYVARWIQGSAQGSTVVIVQH